MTVKVVVTALACACASVAAAQTTQSDTNAFTYVVETFDQVAVHPGPPWLADQPAAVPSIADAGETAPGVMAMIQEWVPAGETLQAWSEHYALFAEAPLPAALADYRNGLIQGYASACADIGLDQRIARPEQEIFVVFCSAYTDQPDLGEVALFHYRKVGGTMVRVYYNRRVPAFQLDGPPPIDAANLVALSDWLAQFRLVPVAN